MSKGPLFLNTPISSLGHDIVGVETYVDKVDTAIDAGARMIAITSPFGAGKSSVIELLQKKREEKSKDRRYKKKSGKERFIEVSMWSHLGNAGEDACPSLHKTFVYQLASQIAPEKGTYVNRRLSQNYGLLRLYANNRIYWLFTLVAILMAAVWWIIHSYDEELKGLIPWLEGKTDALSTILLFGTILFSVFILTRADIIFSSNKSEGERSVEGDEIIDIYRTELLKPRYLRWKWWVKWRKGTHYIVVIEDLDRTDAPEVVLQFLKELRKYYVPEKTTVAYLNRVTFLVNIKPEASLDISEEESLYAKIFDYVLSLRTINIDNYDAILGGLLLEHKAELQALDFVVPEGEGSALSRLPGMQWIIRERRLGIREIKERLNIAFSLFESLRQKFSAEGIAFEKCAAVAYLVTAFEEDFCNTNDRAYQRLVDTYLKEAAENTFADVAEEYGETLSNTSQDYQKAVWELIHAKLIDSSYRTYFYNYPQESHFYTRNESMVMNAILYGEDFSGLEQAAHDLEEQGSSVIESSYQKLKQLGIPLPGFVLEIEPLYVIAVRTCFEDVLKRLMNLDYSSETTQKNLRLFRKMLSFDADRNVVERVHIEEICSLWEREMSEPALLQLRKMLCESFSQEICWYRALFFGVHNIITEEEMRLLSFPNVLQVTNQGNEEFSCKEVEYIIQQFSELGSQEQEEMIGDMEHFLREALPLLGIEKMAKPLLKFMSAIEKIVLDFEAAVGEYIAKDTEKGGESLFAEYQCLINKIAPQGLGEETAERISKIDRYEGYTVETAQCLWANEFYIDYVLIILSQGLEIPYEKEEIINEIQDYYEWLLDRHQDLFVQLRLHIVNTRQQLLERYHFLFGAECPVMSELEIHALEDQRGDIEARVINLIPPAKVGPEEIKYLRDFFCRRKQIAASTVTILDFVAKMNDKTAKDFFYEIDFSKIQYRTLSEKRKTDIKNGLTEVLELEQAENKLKFMNVTQYLDPAWEESLLTELKENKSLQKMYVDAVNSCEKLSKNTIDIITNLGVIYATGPHVTEKAFQAKKYFWYATSKISWEKEFVMEEGARGDLLWRTYLDIFGKARDESWDGIKRSMRNNEHFLYKIMEKEAYRDFGDESRMDLTGILQNSNSISEVFERGNKFALEYYLKIQGFQDRDAASTFVELVCNDPFLLASEELYEHAHGRLVDGVLKGKYTNRRKKSSKL